MTIDVDKLDDELKAAGCPTLARRRPGWYKVEGTNKDRNKVLCEEGKESAVSLLGATESELAEAGICTLTDIEDADEWLFNDIYHQRGSIGEQLIADFLGLGANS